MTVWFDPFRVADAPCDADVVFVTHDHYDHFSPEDIHRVMKPDAVLVLPETCVAAALRAGFTTAQLLPVRPGEAYTVKDLPFTAVPAYNLGKPFHPRGNRWVGYVVTLEGRRVYVAGDTDDTPDRRPGRRSGGRPPPADRRPHPLRLYRGGEDGRRGLCRRPAGGHLRRAADPPMTPYRIPPRRQPMPTRRWR